jgi:hypothetical protein
MTAHHVKQFGLRLNRHAEVFLTADTAQEAVLAARRVLREDPDLPGLMVVERVGQGPRLEWRVNLEATRWIREV